jgi:hypothetical protein
MFDRSPIFYALIALILVGIATAALFSWQSTHSGPFAYFKDAPGKGPITERGERIIAAKLQVGASAAEAETLLRSAGFKCIKNYPPKVLPDMPVPDKNGRTQGIDMWLACKLAHGTLPSFHLGCIWRFGFEGSWWQSSFLADEHGRIASSVHRVTDGPDVQLR